jgi:drug/metabolite transporter (DMT)-like permease
MLVVVFLSLSAAVTYGLSDFVGGLLTRRTSVWSVAATSQASATVLALAVVLTNFGDPGATSFLWGIIAGLGSGVGNVCIYRGLAAGRMAVVAPVSALAAGAVPVLVGFATGERPGVVQVIGVIAALPAIWLVSGGQSGLADRQRSDTTTGLIAGLGFGVQFSSLGQVPSVAGLTPLAVSQAVSVAAIVLGATATSARWLPRDRFSRLGVVPGLLAGVATICFQLAVQQGLLTVAGVLASLYPAVTVLLAATVLREPIDRTQGVGLAVAATAVIAISAG